jgi:phage terminase small subunit
MKAAYRALRPATKRWVDSLRKEYVLESHVERLLVLAGQAWDRAQTAREEIREQGATFLDRWNQRRPNPNVEIENRAMLTFAKLLRETGVDLVRPDDSRPATRPGGY